MTVTEKIVSAVRYDYTGKLVTVTTLYFNDGSDLGLSGHWVLKVGESYRIEYGGEGNPVTVSSVTMKV